MPTKLRRLTKKPALVATIALGLLSSPAALNQQPAAAGPRPKFEVASLKPNPGCENTPHPGVLSPSPGRLEMPCVTFQSLIQTAYGTFGDGVTINTQPLPMEGIPSSLRSEYFSVSAKAEAPARTQMLAGPMLQTLLEDRFRLQTHRELREMPVYAMTVGKGGLKVKPMAEGACTPIDLEHPPPMPKPGAPAPKVCGVLLIRPGANGQMIIEVQGATLTQFAQRLAGRLDRPVEDKTGLTGTFNFRLEFTPDPRMPGQRVPPGRGEDAPNPVSPSEPGPDLFAAIQEQLGLKLSSDKGPVSFLIVDHAEKPTEN